MKKLLLLIFCMYLFAATSKAQYVNIPDSNFRSFLIMQYPSCFNGAGQMDTTCGAIVNEDTIDCRNRGIVNLDGLQYFKSLTVLLCFDNQITSLPILSNSLVDLYCFNNQIANLPDLPNTLKGLNCSFNQITNLLTLPNSLLFLDCSNNKLTNLQMLPNSLFWLFCGNNQISCLPQLPNSLANLDVSNTQIKCIPNSPSSGFAMLNPPLPFCNPTNNLNRCISFPIMQGYVYLDMNTNNKWDNTELGRERTKISLSNGTSTFTQKNGFYEIGVKSIGAYTVSISNPNLFNAQPTSYTHI